MDETNQLSLPLLRASQAQKHVTMNEALARLDGLVPMVLASRSVTVPPPATDGTCHAVPEGAVNDWAGHAGEVAVRVNEGWTFATPARGWRGFLLDEGVAVLHDGTGWRAGAVTLTPHGAGMGLAVAELLHEVTAGATSLTLPLIPPGAILFGVTARVTEAITGGATGWQLGNPGAPDRFGSGLGVAQGSWARGVLSAPMGVYEPLPLLLTATGGVFGGGRVRIAAHFAELALPAD